MPLDKWLSPAFTTRPEDWKAIADETKKRVEGKICKQCKNWYEKVNKDGLCDICVTANKNPDRQYDSKGRLKKTSIPTFEEILPAFKKFCKNGFQPREFTERLYLFLRLESGFIAHYNRTGFFQEYFIKHDDILRFKEKLRPELKTIVEETLGEK